MRALWVFAVLMVVVWATGEDGERPPDGNDDDKAKKDKDAALVQVAQVVRRCVRTQVSAATAVAETLRSYGLRKFVQWR